MVPDGAEASAVRTARRQLSVRQVRGKRRALGAHDVPRGDPVRGHERPARDDSRGALTVRPSTRVSESAKLCPFAPFCEHSSRSVACPGQSTIPTTEASFA